MPAGLSISNRAVYSASGEAETHRSFDTFTEAFVLDRSTNPHLAFGHGPHKCAGVAMARAELRIALEELLAQTDSFEPEGEPEMLGWPVYGPETLPLRCLPYP